MERVRPACLRAQNFCEEYFPALREYSSDDAHSFLKHSEPRLKKNTSQDFTKSLKCVRHYPHRIASLCSPPTATKRPSRAALHRLAALRSDRMVRRFPTARLCAERERCTPGRRPPRGARHAAPLRPARALPAQRGAAAPKTRLAHVDGARCTDA